MEILETEFFSYRQDMRLVSVEVCFQHFGWYQRILGLQALKEELMADNFPEENGLRRLISHWGLQKLNSTVKRKD